eukprot:6239856-Amphidinium_carterae.1
MNQYNADHNKAVSFDNNYTSSQTYQHDHKEQFGTEDLQPIHQQQQGTGETKLHWEARLPRDSEDERYNKVDYDHNTINE